ncbi:MAG: zinc finger domain-containing protein [Acidimicrobiales bacterium]
MPTRPNPALPTWTDWTACQGSNGGKASGAQNGGPPSGEARIRTQTRQEPCTSCGAEPGRACQTRTGRLAEIDHQPRRQAAVATVDAAELAVATS